MTNIERPSGRLTAALVASAAVGVLWVYALSRTVPASATAGGSSDRPTPTATAQPGQAAESRSAGPQNGGTATQSATPEPTPADPAQVPPTGSGRFQIVPGTGAWIGSGGRLVRYRVAVEAEAPVNPADFADAVEEILADHRGWAAHGQWSFQRVDTEDADVTVHLATPSTTDAICGRHGLRTRGEVSCRGGSDVVINLKRWMLGVPWYEDALVDYRRMVTNHEIGHFLGHGHEYCPGPGQLAPVMQTQTAGLKGCLRNPWPYPSG